MENVYQFSTLLLSKWCRHSPKQIFVRKLYRQIKKWEPLTSAKKFEIEEFWSSRISATKPSHQTTLDKKFYVLSMFPYPSGKLHMGHVRVYTISDVLARFHRMNGRDVIHPMGWDSFGLPAENAAIEQNVLPDDWTWSNVKYMKNQLVKLGCSFDWERELATCSPDYYKWTQFLFLKLYEHGLVYRKEALVNWDPVDQTVLAEEQVDANGCSWRSGAKVVKLPLKQWFIKTTKFSHSLSQGLHDLELADWGDIIKLQNHWIGECNGYQFDFPAVEIDYTFNVWTSNPESLKETRFLGLKPGHLYDKPEFYSHKTEEYILLNISVRNMLTKKILPVIVTSNLDYPEGSDTILGDPLTDTKAGHLAYSMKLKVEPQLTCEAGLNSEYICSIALKENWGGFKTSSKLRDWLISRQRYWGTPIPIIHCSNCGVVPVPEKDLPVNLPPLNSTSVSKGRSVLLDNEDFIRVQCSKCGSEAKRETDTMDTFVDSSWYFLRYLDPQNTIHPFDPPKLKSLMPVDIYIGGKEHAVLHLYYARFMSHFLHSLGWLPVREPFQRLLVQGMVMGKSYRIKGTGKYLKQEDIDFTGSKPVEKLTGNPIVVTWEKMSKSKYNGVEPESVWNEHGIDTTRLLILADVSPTSHRHWSKDTYPGILNWQQRLWNTIDEFIRQRQGQSRPLPEDDFKKHEEYMHDSRNFYIKGVTHNIHHTQQISVAISKMQGLTNSLRKVPRSLMINGVQFERSLAAQIIMLSPLAPHFASELWSAFTDNALKESNDVDWNKPVLEQRWPEVDMDYHLELVGKVNGQECCSIKMPRLQLEELSQGKAIEIIREHETFLKYYADKKIVQTEFEVLPGYQTIVSFVTETKPKKAPA